MTKDSDVSSPALVMPPELHCYRLVPDPPQMVPGRSEREWMDDTPERFAYRCTPLSIANASGWELLLPAGLAASWNGGPRASDITIMPRDDNAGL